jgi:hypothetical protein
MKIGFIVDGMAEYHALPSLLSRVKTPATLVTQPLRAGMQPYGSPAKIARDALPGLRILVTRKVDLVVLLIDRENRSECSNEMAEEISQELMKRCSHEGLKIKIVVVVKDRMFENWLVADTDAIQRLPKRFKWSKKSISAITPNKADKVDASELLKTAAMGSVYDKVQDAQKILQIADPMLVGANSRSFRRFLRAVMNPTYKDQSRKPAG